MAGCGGGNVDGGGGDGGGDGREGRGGTLRRWVSGRVAG